MPYWRLFYHVVWATRNREPMIDDERAAAIQRTMRAACHEVGAVVHAVGIMPEHVHIAVSVPPRVAIADMIQKLKGSSSRHLNPGEPRRELDTFAWQSEYGITSLGERSLNQVKVYVEHQAEHHAADNPWPSFKLTERPYPSNYGHEGHEVSSPGRASVGRLSVGLLTPRNRAGQIP